MTQIEYVFIEDENDELGIEDISFVDEPTYESEFLACSADDGLKIRAVDEEKMLAIGPFIKPGLMPKIPLRGRQGRISSETIGKLIDDFNAKKKHKNVSLHHSYKADDCYVQSMWQVDRANGRMAGYGYDEGDKKVPDGAGMVAIKVNNRDIWENDIKKGEVVGFSPTFRLIPMEVAASSYDGALRRLEKEIDDLINNM